MFSNILLHLAHLYFCLPVTCGSPTCWLSPQQPPIVYLHTKHVLLSHLPPVAHLQQFVLIHTCHLLHTPTPVTCCSLPHLSPITHSYTCHMLIPPAPVNCCFHPHLLTCCLLPHLSLVAHLQQVAHSATCCSPLSPASCFVCSHVLFFLHFHICQQLVVSISSSSYSIPHLQSVYRPHTCCWFHTVFFFFGGGRYTFSLIESTMGFLKGR